MKTSAVLVLGIAIAFPLPLLAQQVACTPGTPHPAAPAEIQQFDFLLGRFDIKGRQWTDNGWSQQYSAAYWEGEYILEGFAIADYWYDQPPEVNPSTHRGVNIRMFDPESGLWKMAWMHSSRPAVRMLEAIQQDSVMKMFQLVDPDTRLDRRRTTFIVVDRDNWYRTDEFTDDGGQTWYYTIKLEATRRPC